MRARDTQDRLSEAYSSSFFASYSSGSSRSAQKIVPLIMKQLSPKTVIDVGCGIGTWAAMFLNYGVRRVIGVDGDYVDRQLLLIPESSYMVRDLGQPLAITDHFDLAVSLEVAEHLPADKAQAFVKDLVQLAPAVLFSAAIPYQGGVRHLNEQWQSYWAELFSRYGYVPLDIVRPAVWTDEDVMPWYAQNMFLYASAGVQQELDIEPCRSLALMDAVAPRFYLYQRDVVHRHPEVETAMRQLGRALLRWARDFVQRAASRA